MGKKGAKEVKKIQWKQRYKKWEAMVQGQMMEFGEMEETESLNDDSNSSLSMHGNMYFARQTPQKSVMNKIQGSDSS